MGKVEYNISNFQFDKNKDVNEMLATALQYATKHSSNIYIKNMIKKLPNPFNPAATTTFIRTDMSFSDKLKDYSKDKGIPLDKLSLKEKAEFSNYDKQCLENANILNRIHGMCGTKEAVHPDIQEKFKNICLDTNNFIAYAFQLGLDCSISKDDLSKLFATECNLLGYNPKPKYLTKESVEKWQKESDLVEYLEYCNKIGFASRFMGDMVRYGNINERSFKEILNVTQLLFHPDVKINKDFMDLYGRKTIYEDLIKSDDDKGYVVRTIYSDLLKSTNKPLLKESVIDRNYEPDMQK